MEINPVVENNVLKKIEPIVEVTPDETISKKEAALTVLSQLDKQKRIVGAFTAITLIGWGLTQMSGIFELGGPAICIIYAIWKIKENLDYETYLKFKYKIK